MPAAFAGFDWFMALAGIGVAALVMVKGVYWMGSSLLREGLEWTLRHKIGISVFMTLLACLAAYKFWPIL